MNSVIKFPITPEEQRRRDAMLAMWTWYKDRSAELLQEYGVYGMGDAVTQAIRETEHRFLWWWVEEEP